MELEIPVQRFQGFDEWELEDGYKVTLGNVLCSFRHDFEERHWKQQRMIQTVANTGTPTPTFIKLAETAYLMTPLQ